MSVSGRLWIQDEKSVQRNCVPWQADHVPFLPLLWHLQFVGGTLERAYGSTGARASARCPFPGVSIRQISTFGTDKDSRFRPVSKTYTEVCSPLLQICF